MLRLRCAVRVEWDGHKLGRVPRADNTVAARLLRRAEWPGARVSVLRGSRDPSERIEVLVELEIPNA